MYMYMYMDWHWHWWDEDDFHCKNWNDSNDSNDDDDGVRRRIEVVLVLDLLWVVEEAGVVEGPGARGDCDNYDSWCLCAWLN